MTRQFGRTLIWRFRDASGTRSGLPIGYEIVGVDGAPLAIADDARVLVWHPTRCPDATKPRGTFFVNPRTGVMLIASNLPTPAAGRAY